MSETKSLSRVPIAGVIGDPIAHSKSPILFRHWLDAYGIKGHYVPLHIHPNSLKEALITLPKIGFVGVNVTIPHKETVLKLADVVSDRAGEIGAANTLTFEKDGKIHADNTDGYGFFENLRQNAPKWDPTSGPAIVLCAGGAARAVLSSLIAAGVPEIILTNRTFSRAATLHKEFGNKIRVVHWEDAAENLGLGKVVINTTSLGMAGKENLNLDLTGLHSDQLVTDLVYTPLQTNLLKAAQEKIEERRVGKECVTQ